MTGGVQAPYHCLNTWIRVDMNDDESSRHPRHVIRHTGETTAQAPSADLIQDDAHVNDPRTDELLVRWEAE